MDRCDSAAAFFHGRCGREKIDGSKKHPPDDGCFFDPLRFQRGTRRVFARVSGKITAFLKCRDNAARIAFLDEVADSITADGFHQRLHQFIVFVTRLDGNNVHVR